MRAIFKNHIPASPKSTIASVNDNIVFSPHNLPPPPGRFVPIVLADKGAG
jgi:hypothetical protein